jgi:hypothetical protein
MWYVYDKKSNTWKADKGEHSGWPAGREGEERLDSSDGSYYRYSGNRWVWARNKKD